MRGKKLGRLLGVVAAVALAVGATSQAAFAGGVHSQKTPPNVPGFNGSTIKLGVITPQSGIASVVGKPLTLGNQVYWQAVNAKGGVAGKYKVDLSVQDSQYDVATALQGYDSIKGDVVAFQQILGTQTVKTDNQPLKAAQRFAAPASLEAVCVIVPECAPSGTGSSTAPTVTVCAVHQLPGPGQLPVVKVKGEGVAVACAPGFKAIVTLATGSLVNTTV